jgi:hypothetical protein
MHSGKRTDPNVSDESSWFHPTRPRRTGVRRRENFIAKKAKGEEKKAAEKAEAAASAKRTHAQKKLSRRPKGRS